MSATVATARPEQGTATVEHGRPCRDVQLDDLIVAIKGARRHARLRQKPGNVA